MTSLLQSLQRTWPESSWQGSPIVIAVSGGPDSVALLHALHQISRGRSPFIVAHVDHGLRGTESDRDREFVRDLAMHLGCGFELKILERELGDAGKTSEDSLRRARHHFLREVAERHSAAWIATGHQADDCVETFIHHLLRGSGPLGLGSIAPVRKIAAGIQLVHPFLSVSRNTILEYLEHHSHAYRTDSSNGSLNYTRNRIRHELLPYLRQFVDTPHLDRRIWNASQQIREEHALVESMAHTWLANCHLLECSDGFEFSADACHETHWAVVRQGLVQLWHARGWSLREMSTKHWDRVRGLIDWSKTSPHPRQLHLPGKIQVTMRRHRVRFSHRDDSLPTQDLSLVT